MAKASRKFAVPGILCLVGIGVQWMPNIQSWLWSGIIWGGAFIWFLLVFVDWRRHRYSGSALLELKIIPNKWLSDCKVNGKSIKNPSYSLVPGHTFSAIFGLILANHSQQHKVHIDSAHIILREKKWLWSGKPLFSLPVEIQNYPNDHILQNVDIEPQSKKEYSINTGGIIPTISPFPRVSRLILVLEFVGDTRRIERTLEEFRHDPKQVPDIPDWRKQ